MNHPNYQQDTGGRISGISAFRNIFPVVSKLRSDSSRILSGDLHKHRITTTISYAAGCLKTPTSLQIVQQLIREENIKSLHD